MGYDVMDHKAVSPEFGTMDDLDELLQEVEAKGDPTLFIQCGIQGLPVYGILAQIGFIIILTHPFNILKISLKIKSFQENLKTLRN